MPGTGGQKYRCMKSNKLLLLLWPKSPNTAQHVVQKLLVKKYIYSLQTKLVFLQHNSTPLEQGGGYGRAPAPHTANPSSRPFSHTEQLPGV